MSCWCLLAGACAGAMYWVALRSFDRRLGRMRETSQGARAIEPPRLVAVGGVSVRGAVTLLAPQTESRGCPLEPGEAIQGSMSATAIRPASIPSIDTATS
jgi:hypothetical protein